jgi:hypothetical protein
MRELTSIELQAVSGGLRIATCHPVYRPVCRPIKVVVCRPEPRCGLWLEPRPPDKTRLSLCLRDPLSSGGGSFPCFGSVSGSAATPPRPSKPLDLLRCHGVAECGSAFGGPVGEGHSDDARVSRPSLGGCERQGTGWIV